MEKIILGTVGTGFIVSCILEGVERTGGIELGAVYSRSREKGEALSAKYGNAPVYTDLEAFFSSGINTVYIALPNLLHYDMARRALNAGLNVLLEKPFTTALWQAEELFRLAEEKGLMLLEMVPTCFLPLFGELKEAVTAVGPVRLVLANFSQYSSRFDALKAGQLPNIFNPALGGGALPDINYYNLYLTTALFGKPESGCYFSNLRNGNIDTSGVAVLRYDGFTVSCAGAKDCGGENRYLIEGEDGYIAVEGGAVGLTELRIHTREGERRIPGGGLKERWNEEIRAIVPILLREDWEALNRCREDTLAAVATLEEIRREAGIIYPGEEKEHE